MSWFEAIILGLVQGLTEFLPVSSSGHLAIAKTLFGIETGDISFEIVVHAATVLSVLVVFWKDIIKLLEGLFKFKFNSETKYILFLVISMIPVFVVGMFFKDKVEALFGNGLLVVGCALLVTAALLALSQLYKPRQKDINGWRAFIIGCAQAVAVIPGLSRSGATIATGLLCGVKRDEIARFSFLMVLVPILGEAFLDLIGGGFAGSGIGALPLILGFLAAFASGLFACKAMIALVKKANLGWFAAYCAIVGILCIIFH
ncbi:MAG: undecaprenyl-diphosphate phosphatase [Bacteroidales bacterium]|nr:undecaprenyl-diphosphate phosphatase [Bacteroidales bacterium]